ncbi:MAG: DUF3179 domain-containing protein [Patescibacteria group bacterium]
MNRSKTIIVAVLILAVFGVYAYWQSRVYRTPVSVGPSPSIEEQIVSGGPNRDGIPAIDKPIFETVSAADQYLDNDGFGLVVTSGTRVRFYPYQILVWHEIVNDSFDGKPLLVTYCPLTYTGLVFDPQINTETFLFGTSGKLLNNNLLMQDRKTNSLWSQAIGEAVVGDLKGTQLKLRPSFTITWADFKDTFPNGMVLSRRTGVVRDYTHDPYGNYHTTNAVLFPLSHVDSRLETKKLVFGYKTPDEQKAYPTDVIQKMLIVNDEVDEHSLFVFWDPDLKTVRGYFRDPTGTPLTFEWQDNRLVDRETHSVWNTEGKAISGSLRGTSLTAVPLENHFWFSWAAFHPNTNVLTP